MTQTVEIHTQAIADVQSAQTDPANVRRAQRRAQARAQAHAWSRRGAWVALRLGVVLLSWRLLQAGLQIRHDIWFELVPIRFYYDISNALRQGNAVVAEGEHLANSGPDHPLTRLQFFSGFLHRYDSVVDNAADPNFSLDYTPARLLIVSMWAWHVHEIDPKAQRYRDVYAEPLLRLNTTCEITATVLMFLLVRHWVRRQRGSARSPLAQLRDPAGPRILGGEDLPWIMGLLSATVFWFDPPILLNAHVWPQWDSWLLPFLVGALLLASCEWWFAAGAAVAIGAMFKGQILIIAPLFILWPLFGGRISAVVRVGIGFIVGAALMVSPWLVGGGWLWVVGIVVAATAIAVFSRHGNWLRSGIGGWIAAGAIALFIAQPWAAAWQWPTLWAIPLLVFMLTTPWIVRWLTRWGTAVWLSFIGATAIVLASDAFGGSWSWWEVGFRYPTRHHYMLSPGFSCNLSTLLSKVYGWNIDDTVYTFHLGSHGPWVMSVRIMLSCMYGLTLGLCAAAAAFHSRRNDARTLVALTAPWVLMYALAPQMMTRYLMWGALLGSVGWAVSIELAMLNLITVATSTVLILHTLLGNRPSPLSPYPKLNAFEGNTYPGLSWLVVLLGAIYLYQAIVPRRRRSALRFMQPSSAQRGFDVVVR